MPDLPQQMRRRLLGLSFCAFGALLSGCATDSGNEASPDPYVWPSPEEPRFYWEQTIRSSADVVAETRAELLRRVATGETMAGKPLEKPYGVAAHEGLLFVSDTLARRVHAFDIPGKRYFVIGDKGVGALAKPLAVAVANGLLYVCDATGKRVVVFDLEGNYKMSIGNKEELSRPSGITLSKDGSRLYVVDTGGVDTDRHRIMTYDAKTGEHLFEIGTRGNDSGDFNLPISAATNANGNIYVVDGGNFRVQAFTPGGEFVKSFGEVGRMSGHFARPKAIAADQHGNVYVTDSAFANFQIFDENGTLLLFIGQRGESGAPGEYMLPAGIAIDPADGRVYVADQFFRKVEVFRPAGVPAERPPRESQAPAAAAESKKVPKE